MSLPEIFRKHAIKQLIENFQESYQEQVYLELLRGFSDKELCDIQEYKLLNLTLEALIRIEKNKKKLK